MFKDQPAEAVKSTIPEYETIFDNVARRLYIVNRKQTTWFCLDGGQYCNTQFEECHIKKGIIHQINDPYSPASNGRAE